MKNGWIKLHRKSFENKYYFAEVFTKWQAWVDLLLLANHEDNYFEIRGNPITTKRGQVAYANETLAKRWRWSRGKVERFLKTLENDSQIEQQKGSILTLIIIKNYNDYQKTEQQIEQQTSDRQSINKNDKKVKEYIYKDGSRHKFKDGTTGIMRWGEWVDIKNHVKLGYEYLKELK